MGKTVCWAWLGKPLFLWNPSNLAWLVAKREVLPPVVRTASLMDKWKFPDPLPQFLLAQLLNILENTGIFTQQTVIL